MIREKLRGEKKPICFRRDFRAVLLFLFIGRACYYLFYQDGLVVGETSTSCVMADDGVSLRSSPAYRSRRRLSMPKKGRIGVWYISSDPIDGLDLGVGYL